MIQAIDASNIVNEAAKQVSQGSTDLSGRVQEQAAALEETSATMNQMAKPNLLCNLSGGRVLIKRNSIEIWREGVRKPRSMVLRVPPLQAMRRHQQFPALGNYLSRDP